MKSKINTVQDIYTRNDSNAERISTTETKLLTAMERVSKLEATLEKRKAKQSSMVASLARLMKAHLGAKRAEVLGPFGAEGKCVIDLVFDTEVRSASVLVAKSENDNGARLYCNGTAVAQDASLDTVAESFPCNEYATAKLLNQKRAPRKAKTEAEAPATDAAVA